MKGLKRKLTDSKGETLIEVVASILIGALSILMLFTGLMASFQMNLAAGQSDETFYRVLNEAEAQNNPVEQAQVKVLMDGTKQVDFSVNVFGGEGLYSYKQQ